MSESPPPVIRVLLVDDQKMIGEVVRRLLADQADIAYHFCSDPAEALGRAREVRPHVILQDLIMPEIGGLDLVGQYRADPATAGTAVIILSSADEAKMQFEAVEAGATDFLVKLPNKADLLACIRRHAAASEGG